MSPPPRTLQSAHRWLLALLAVAALAIGLGDFGPQQPPPSPSTTTIAFVLALAAITFRRFASSPVVARRTAHQLALASLAMSAGLGILGLFVAYQQNAGETGLLFCLAGFLFGLRPPRPVAPTEGN